MQQQKIHGYPQQQPPCTDPRVRHLSNQLATPALHPKLIFFEPEWTFSGLDTDRSRTTEAQAREVRPFASVRLAPQ
jgi:hypothetical protein